MILNVDCILCRDLLPAADVDHLMVADCPFSHLTDLPVAVIYDASGKGETNPTASRLTTNVESGLQINVSGSSNLYD